MFAWLKKASHPHRREPDAVWMTGEARIHGVIAAARKALERREKVGIGTYDLATFRALQAARGNVAVEVLEEHQLNTSRLAGLSQGAPKLRLLLAGASLDPDAEDKLLTQCKALPCIIHLQVHHSLTDPLMTQFAPPSLRPMLEKLGMKADEAIEHRWVSRAIDSARRKSRR